MFIFGGKIWLTQSFRISFFSWTLIIHWSLRTNNFMYPLLLLSRGLLHLMKVGDNLGILVGIHNWTNSLRILRCTYWNIDLCCFGFIVHSIMDTGVFTILSSCEIEMLSWCWLWVKFSIEHILSISLRRYSKFLEMLLKLIKWLISVY